VNFGIPLAPEQASDYAERWEPLFWYITGLSLFFTLLVAGFVFAFAVRYRAGRRADRSRPQNHNTRLEAGVILVLIALSLSAFGWATKLYTDVYGPPPANAEEIFVVGKQWMWHIQHTNGVRENNELHIAAGRPVKLTLISQDVIHAFFIPAFRAKRYVLPGRYTMFWFTPTKVGTYHLYCSQYCGTEHSEMGGWVTVMSPADYAQWLRTGSPRTNPTGLGTDGQSSMAEAGAKWYQQLACGNCHDPELNRAPTLVARYGQMGALPDGRASRVDDAYLREWILNPPNRVSPEFQQVMPSYKGQLTEDNLLQLIAYIRTLTPPTVPRRAPVGGGQTRKGTGQASEGAVLIPGSRTQSGSRPQGTGGGTLP